MFYSHSRRHLVPMLVYALLKTLQKIGRCLFGSHGIKLKVMQGCKMRSRLSCSVHAFCSLGHDVFYLSNVTKITPRDLRALCDGALALIPPFHAYSTPTSK